MSDVNREVTMEKVVALSKTEDSFIRVRRFTEALQTHGITVLWEQNLRTM